MAGGSWVDVARKVNGILVVVKLFVRMAAGILAIHFDIEGVRNPIRLLLERARLHSAGHSRFVAGAYCILRWLGGNHLPYCLHRLGALGQGALIGDIRIRHRHRAAGTGRLADIWKRCRGNP